LPAPAGHQLSFISSDGKIPTLVEREGKARFVRRSAHRGYLLQGLGRGLDLNSMDGRARLADRRCRTSEPFQMVCTGADDGRLATIATSPEALQRGEDVEGPPAADRRTKATSRLSERLLTILLKHPEFLAKLDDLRRARLIGIGDSLLGRVVRHLAEQPDSDLASLLGYWAGQDGHETLLELADRPLVLNDEALGDEFATLSRSALSSRAGESSGFLEVLRKVRRGACTVLAPQTEAD
jgi:hypothetical protein